MDGVDGGGDEAAADVDGVEVASEQDPLHNTIEIPQVPGVQARST